VESLLGQAEVSALETRLPVRKGRNFRSERWIALKFLQEFPDAIFLAVDVESLLGDRRSLLSRPGYRFESAVTFDPIVGSPSSFYRSFRTPFSMQLMWNRYSVRWRSLLSRPGYRFERAVTFDPIVGSPSSFYRSFRTPFSMQLMWNRYSVSGGLYFRDQVTGSKGP